MMNSRDIDAEIAALQAEKVALQRAEQARRRAEDEARRHDAGGRVRELVAAYNSLEVAQRPILEELFRVLSAFASPTTVHFEGGAQWSCNLLRLTADGREQQLGEAEAMRLVSRGIQRVEAGDLGLG